MEIFVSILLFAAFFGLAIWAYCLRDEFFSKVFTWTGFILSGLSAAWFYYLVLGISVLWWKILLAVLLGGATVFFILIILGVIALGLCAKAFIQSE